VCSSEKGLGTDDRLIHDVLRQPSLSFYLLLRLSFTLTCIISKSEVENSVYCIFYVREQAAKRMLKTREMLPASFNFQFQAPSRSSTAMIAAMVDRAMITMGRNVGPIK